MIYGNYLNESYELSDHNIYLPENNFSDEVIEENALKDTIEMINKWNTDTQVQRIKKYYNDFISNEDYKMLNGLIKTMKKSKDYSTYKDAFKKFCKYCSILPEHVIISKYKLHKSSKDDHNSLHVHYSNNNKKITLPEGTKLFHISKVKGISALRPSYQGKSERGYLYDKPRIYFTIMKHMPSFLADYNFMDKLYKYQATKDIKEVYVDPLVWSVAQGAVYIETTSEIPVKSVSMDLFNDLKNNIKF